MNNQDVVYIRYVAITYTDSTRNYCYLVADGQDGLGNNSGPDLLTILLKSGSEAAIGSTTGTYNVEAIAFQPGTTTLYAADEQTTGTRGVFGSINIHSGIFTQISPVGGIGAGTGSLGSITFVDVDSLSFDPFSGVLYAVRRRAGTPNPPDILFQINPATGTYVQNAFGPGADYLVIPDAGNTNWTDIDDIAVSSYDGVLYGVANADGTNDELVIINKTTAALTRVGTGLTVNDMEGLSFDVEGNLFGSTGDAQGPPNSNKLWDISVTTGVASNGRTLRQGSDYEGSNCLTWGTNDIHGTVFLDSNYNGVLDPAETGTPGVSVRLYRDLNGNGWIDAGEPVLTSLDTDASGNYAFGLAGGVAAIGNFAIDIEHADLPAGHSLTTDNLESAAFTTVGNSDIHNNFGHADYAASVDYGDLPDSYNDTLYTENGARHMSGSAYLGAAVDAEPDGQENPNASADTNDDGVTRTAGLAWHTGANGGSIDVTASGCSGTCYLSAWLDWDNDHAFSQAGDTILLDEPVSDGPQTVTFRYPCRGHVRHL